MLKIYAFDHNIFEVHDAWYIFDSQQEKRNIKF